MVLRDFSREKCGARNCGKNWPIFGQFLAKFDQKIDQFSSKLAAILIRSVMLFLSLVLIAFTKLSLKSILKNQYKKLCKELEVQNIRIFHNEILCIECRFTLPWKLFKIWSNLAPKWPKIGTFVFSHFSQFLARNRSIFLASREKSKTREMCTSSRNSFRNNSVKI